MTDKQRKTFTVDPQNAELCEQLDNASAVVNDLLTQYRKTGDSDTVALELQIQQKEREEREKKRELERVQQDKEELQELKRQLSSQESAELQEAREALDGVPHEPTNPGIKNWSDKLGIEPQKLIDRL